MSGAIGNSHGIIVWILLRKAANLEIAGEKIVDLLCIGYEKCSLWLRLH